MAVAPTNKGFLTLLKKKNFLRLWLAQLISMTILNASNYALLILIEDATHSTTLVGLAIICFSIPAVLFGAPAGVFVDRMDKRRVLWESNCLRAVVTLIFAVVLLANRSSVLVPIYLLTFIISSIGQFFSPAEGSAIPMLVSEEELTPALSLFNITFMLSQALGYILLAPIAISVLPTITLFQLTIDSITQLYVAIAILYLICAGLVLAIPQAGFVSNTTEATELSQNLPTFTAQTMSIWHKVKGEMVEGWHFISKSNALLLAVIQLSFAGVLLLLIGQLATPIVTDLLALPINMMAFVFAPAGIGLVVGSLLIPRILQRLGQTRTIFIGCVILATTMLLAPLITDLVRWLEPQSWHQDPLLLIIIGVLMFIAGVGIDFLNVPAQTAIQALTPEWIKGRVLSLQLALYNACSIPVILFVGIISDRYGIDHVLYLIAAANFSFGLWGVYFARKHVHDDYPGDDHHGHGPIGKEVISSID
jgi:MFS family permease